MIKRITSAFKLGRLFAIMLLLSLSSACDNAPTSRVYERLSPYDFEETLLNLDIAISEYNYRIIHRSHIGQAVRDRGDTAFPLSTITSFCNITYAKEMIEINPDLINDMPCIAAVRETNDNTVIVSTRLMDETTGGAAQQAFAKKINRNLISIVNSTTD
jgi:uncharacterized protein (DUF302 family)